MNHTNYQKGLTLVEIIVAIAVFSIIMLALSGTIVQGLQLRRNNSIDAQSIAYATSILETYKNFWASSAKYTANKPPTLPTTPLGLQEAVANTDILLSCLNADGSDSTTTTCALRRVHVRVKDLKGTIRADLVTEIGNPER
jgi:prepilin-type N-terminal cleavage/methylation domain-containing protein